MPGYVPAPASGGFRPTDMVGALVLVDVMAFQPQQQGSYGTKDAVMVNVHVVDFPQQPHRRGESYRNVQLLNVALVGQLGGMVNQTVLGRLEAVQGKQINPAIRLAEPTAADMQLADAFLAQPQQPQQQAPQPYPAQPQSQPVPYPPQPQQQRPPQQWPPQQPAQQQPQYPDQPGF